MAFGQGTISLYIEYAFSLPVKKYQYFSKESGSNKDVFRIPTPGPIKNANSLTSFQF